MSGSGISGGGGVSYPLLAPDGTAAAPSYSFLNSTGGGMFLETGTSNVGFAAAGSVMVGLVAGAYLSIGVGLGLAFSSGSPTVTSADTGFFRLAAASIRQGLAPSATPVAQLFTLGEASRPATDSNVGGASGTVRSGLGTGTGTASSLLFQTPTLAASGTGTQAYATRLTVGTTEVTATVPMAVPAGSFAAAAITLNSTVGIYSQGAGNIAFTQPGVEYARTIANTMLLGSAAGGTGVFGDGAVTAGVLALSPGGIFGWTGTASDATAARDLALARLAAASLRQGLAPSATPVAQVFTLGEATRPGTDSNTSGASGTIRSGLGTGNVNASTLIFQTPNAVGSGSATQTYSTRLTIDTAGITATVPLIAQSSNAAASGLSFAGNPTFGYSFDSFFGMVAYGTGGLACAIGGNVTNPLIFGSGGTMAWANAALTAGGAVTMDIGLIRSAAGVLEVNNSATGTFRDLSLRTLVVNGTTAATVNFVAPTNGAAAQVGTLTNAPSAGNPSFWIAIQIGGATRYIPAWT